MIPDPDMRVAFSMGFGRLLHTLLGVLIAIIAIALFGGLHRWLLPVTLSFTALICGLFLHFRGSWRVVLVTVTLIIGSTLLDPTAGLHIALMRAVEVSTGSILAIIFSRIVAQTRPDTDNIEKPYADPQSK